MNTFSVFFLKGKSVPMHEVSFEHLCAVNLELTI